jgi:signal transduction histidine kinase
VLGSRKAAPAAAIIGGVSVASRRVRFIRCRPEMRCSSALGPSIVKLGAWAGHWYLLRYSTASRDDTILVCVLSSTTDGHEAPRFDHLPASGEPRARREGHVLTGGRISRSDSGADPALGQVAGGPFLLACLIAALLVAGTVLVPAIRGTPGPGAVDVAVPCVLLLCSAVLVDRGRRWPAGLLGLAGVLWCLVGLAAGAPGPVTDTVTRLALVPLALVVTVLAELPATGPSAARVPGIAAMTIALAGGLGLAFPIRAAIGTVLLVTGLFALVRLGGAGPMGSWLGRVSVALQLGVGGMLLALDPLFSGWLVPSERSADLVGLTIAVAVGAALWTLNPDRVASGRTSKAAGNSLSIERWLADLLGAPGLRVIYPAGGGRTLREDGSVGLAPNGPALVRPDGLVVAWFDRPVTVDPALRAQLRRLLETVGASARLRAAQLEQSSELARSRARLAEAALSERVALERRLAQSVVPLLDAIEARASQLPNPDLMLARVMAARGQVRRAAQGLAPVGTRPLAESLGDLASLSPDRITLDVAALSGATDEPSPDLGEATAMWFAAAEAVTNALKHARGASVLVCASGPCRLEVVDSGPGGADPAGSGLAGIRDRLAAVGGRVEVASGHAGTRVTVTVPGRIRAGSYVGGGLPATPDPAPASYGR